MGAYLNDIKIIGPEEIGNEISNTLGNVIAVANELAANVSVGDGRTRAAEFGSQIVTKEKELRAMQKRILGPIKEALETAEQPFREQLTALAEAKKALANSISRIDIERERLAAIEREKMEADRRRIQAEHEEAMRKQREDQLEQFKAEENARLERAETAKNLGLDDRIDRILDSPTVLAPAQPVAMCPPPPVPVQAVSAEPKDQNTVKRDEWKCEVVDALVLAQAALEGRIPLDYITIEVNKRPILRDARLNGDTFKCPGVRVWRERTTGFRG